MKQNPINVNELWSSIKNALRELISVQVYSKSEHATHLQQGLKVSFFSAFSNCFMINKYICKSNELINVFIDSFMLPYTKKHIHFNYLYN